MRASRASHAFVIILALQALTRPVLGHAEEAHYRMVASTLQQASLERGNLRTDPAMRFVEMLLAPAENRRGASYEHRFPSPGASSKPVRLLTRDANGFDHSRFARKHPFEHTFRRIVVYWGCGENAGPGQPRVIHVHPEDDERLSRLLPLNPERSVTSDSIERVASAQRMIAGRDVRWPEQARMAGSHELRLGLASARFDVDAAAEPLPSVAITELSALPDGPIRVSWEPVPQAGAYFANVFVQRKLSREVVIWTSSRVPEGGWLLYKAHPGTELDRMVASGVLLAPDTDRCIVPAQVRRHTPDPMVLQIHAYAPEVEVKAHARNGALPGAVRIASKSTASLLLDGVDPQRAAAHAH